MELNRRLVLVGVAMAALTAVLVIAWRGNRPADLVLNIEPLPAESNITVYVGGSVVNPGLYQLPQRSRVAQVVEQAVPLESADLTAVGMATVLKDGQQIIVPQRRSVAVVAAESFSTPPGPSAQAPVGPINVNTATAAELEALPGVGPVVASRIVEYRSMNGPFQTLDDLEAVRGISARMIDDFRSMATTGNQP